MSRNVKWSAIRTVYGFSRVLLWILLFCVPCIFWSVHEIQAEAASASITVQARDEKLVEGDSVYVLVTISSMEDIYGFEGYFSYDSRYLKFLSGGKLVHGNDDEFHIQDVERSTGTNKIIYSIRFKARKAGSTSVELRKPYHVLGKGNTKMSVSYDGINMLIVEKSKQSVSPQPVATEDTWIETKEPATEEPESPPPSRLPQDISLLHQEGDVIGSVDLKRLVVRGAELAPAFSPDIIQYSAVLTTSETMADISYKTADSLAKVTIRGNEALQNGKNVIKLVVKNGTKKKTYRISLSVKILRGINRVSSNKVVVEHVRKKTYLSGDITIEAGEVEEEEKLPDGFLEVIVPIDGKSVNGYAYQGDLEQGYILIYGKNTQSFYVYDQKKEQLLPYEQVRNWYRSMGGQDLSELEKTEKKLKSYQYVLGIMGAFCGLMFLLMMFFALRKRR